MNILHSSVGIYVTTSLVQSIRVFFFRGSCRLFGCFSRVSCQPCQRHLTSGSPSSQSWAVEPCPWWRDGAKASKISRVVSRFGVFVVVVFVVVVVVVVVVVLRGGGGDFPDLK